MSKELIERLRNSCEDAIQPDDVYEAADLIEQQQREIEFLIGGPVPLVQWQVMEQRLDSAEKLIEQLVEALSDCVDYWVPTSGNTPHEDETLGRYSQVLAAAKQWKEGV